MPIGVIVQEVCRFDISVQNTSSVNMGKGTEKTSEVVSHVVYQKVSVVESKIQMTKIGQNSDNLIEMPKSCQERTNVR